LRNVSGEAGGWNFRTGSDISRRGRDKSRADPRYGGKDHLGRSLYHPQATFWRRDHAV